MRKVRRRWFNSYYTLTFDENVWDLPKEERLKQFLEEYNNHKFRKREYYDKYLDKMLYKYALSLSDYYDCKNKGGRR